MITRRFLPLITLALLFAALTTGCQKKAPLIEGFERFDNRGQKFTIQYPSGWTFLNGSSGKEDIVAELGLHGDAGARLISQLEGTDISELCAWYDLTDAQADFSRNINLTRSRQAGLTQRDLPAEGNMSQFRTFMETHGPQSYEGFKALRQPETVQIGKNIFIVFAFEQSWGRTNVSSYHAYTADRGYLYMFTCSAESGDFAAAAELFEMMLGTLEFD